MHHRGCVRWATILVATSGCMKDSQREAYLIDGNEIDAVLDGISLKGSIMELYGLPVGI